MIRVLYVGCGFCSSHSLAADLPVHLHGHADVDLIVPHIDGIDEGNAKLAERLIDCKVDIAGSTIQPRILEGRRDNHLRTFYIDAPCLKSPLQLRSDEGIYACAVFAKAVCSWIAQSPLVYDIVHCDGILAALLPVLLKHSVSDRCRNVKSVVMLPGIADKACIDMSWLAKLGLPQSLASSEGVEFYGKFSILKSVYLYADAIAFPGDDVKSKIQHNRGKDIGMEGVLFNKIDHLHRIRLGIDKANYSPEKDKAMEAFYSDSDLTGKNKCKAALVQKLRIKKDRPLVTFIGKLDASSGIDLVNDILDDLMDRPVSLLIVGAGNNAYNHAIEGWKSEFKGCIATCLKNDLQDADLRRILSASDILLLPGQNETLSRIHLIAMKYGCVVVARNTSAVGDIHAVSDIDNVSDDDNGFTFRDYDSDQFFDAAMDALDVYSTPAWNKIRACAMKVDASIDNTVRDCMDIYTSLRS